jgi:protein-tyrosine phosphatase
MDQSNVDNIKSINPNLKGQLFKLLEFSNMEESDVPDLLRCSLLNYHKMIIPCRIHLQNYSCSMDLVHHSLPYNLIDYIVKDANLKEG